MRKTILFTTVLTLNLFAQAPEGKTAGEVYKNVTELKDIPADQLGPAMQFIATSLGVQCDTCHVAGKMEADDKRAKKTAREMIAMTMAINKNAFRGQTQVTCYTCHRGSERPVAIPPVLETDAPVKPEARPSAPATPPTADSIIEKYVTALGGADAMKKVTSRVGKGVITSSGKETPIEVFTKAPNKRITVTHGAQRQLHRLRWHHRLDGLGRPARARNVACRRRRVGARFRVLSAPAHEGNFHAAPSRPAGQNWGRPRPDAHRDAGRACRRCASSSTPIQGCCCGWSATRRIRWAACRSRSTTPIIAEVDGVKTPFRWTLSRPNGRFTIQLNEVKANVAIEDSKFAKPPPKRSDAETDCRKTRSERKVGRMHPWSAPLKPQKSHRKGFSATSEAGAT